ncbi:MAG: SpoVR family protein [Candidatus Parcubacteria bacterium]|nr:SpoVR family protein [Candidatus Parcubacteria bacterium]
MSKRKNKDTAAKKGKKTVAADSKFLAEIIDGKPASEWSFGQLDKVEKEIGKIAQDEYRLDTYPNQIEVITSEQMLDAYASIGLPIFYHHWSFGKHFIQQHESYHRGEMGLAYEMVINSNPCIAYLMEENTALMQMLVIAHACYGHNSFFKGNRLFRKWTDAGSIVDYLIFARDYITKCEELYGVENVEFLLDACHSLQEYGVDRYRHPPKLTVSEERNHQSQRAAFLQSQVNDLWLHVLPKEEKDQKERKRFPKNPEENLLYFIEKNSPALQTWEREIVRITRKISQYFYPQRQTKVMNEGWATFWHYTLLNRLDEQGRMPPGYMLEFLKSHTAVVAQPGYDSPYFSGLNPYVLGFNIFRDIRRICEHPTEEDKKWFPEIAGAPWLPTVHTAMEDFKDESFILQFLSPKVIRDMKLWGLIDDPFKNPKHFEVAAIHDNEGYREIRKMLAEEHDMGILQPNIEVYDVNNRTRELILRHTPYNGKGLDKNSLYEVLRSVYTVLWGYPVRMESPNEKGEMKLISQCPDPYLKI